MINYDTIIKNWASSSNKNQEVKLHEGEREAVENIEKNTYSEVQQDLDQIEDNREQDSETVNSRSRRQVRKTN